MALLGEGEGMVGGFLELFLRGGSRQDVFGPGFAGHGADQHGTDDVAGLDQANQVVGHGLGAKDFGMLDEVNAGEDREAQTFDGGGVGFGAAVALVSFVDHDFLRFGREPDVGGFREMAGAAEFEEIGAFVEVFVDRDAELIGSQVVQLFAGALGDVVVHLLLKKSQVFIGREAEAEGVRASPADDVPGGLDACADGVAVLDLVADMRERKQHAVAVPYRGDAVGKVDLGGLEYDFVLARLIADQGFVAFTSSSVEGEMDVGVDESGGDVAAFGVDDGRGGRDFCGRIEDRRR